MSCPSGKVPFRRRRDALFALERIRNTCHRLHATHKRPTHYYRCSHCGSWHLTSQERRVS